MSNDKVNKFLSGYSGIDLLTRYEMSQVGVWQIFGEDPNCDMGGSHIQPLLGTVSGELRAVIEYGVTLPAFFQWGSGGTFKLITATPVEEAAKVKVAKEEIARKIKALEAELKALKAL